MTLTVRVVAPDDDLDALLAGTLTWTGSERTAAVFAAARETASEQFVAVTDGRIVGYGHLLTVPVAEGGRAGAHVFVDPPFRDRGVGSASWRVVLNAA